MTKKIKNTFTRVPNDVFDKISNPYIFRIYYYLWREYDEEYNCCYRTYEQMAKDCHMSLLTTKKCIAWLIDNGYIIKRKFRGVTNAYYHNNENNKKNTPLIANKICGMGINDIPQGYKHILYGRWEQMISRCYDDSNPAYKNYGAKGVYVCEEWLTFSNYIKDIERKENYDKLCQNPKNWEIDKDILVLGNKYYSNETTLIITKSENSRYAATQYWNNKRQ